MNKQLVTITLSILLSCLSFCPIDMQAQTKRALVIGIGEQEDAGWNKINGDKDVRFVKEMLDDAGFERISTCVNKQATKKGIVNEFKRLAAECKQGDIVYVHYSGHGQQMKDMNGDESDGLDECWIPYDAYRKPCAKDRGEKHLTDDEINILLNNVRNRIGDKGKMLVVIDACHSGDGTRGDDDEVVRGVEDVFEAIKSLVKKQTAPKVVANKERWITVSACESNQVNIEMKKPSVGKLTYAIYTTIKNHDVCDNSEWFTRIKKFINCNTGSRPQRPVMSGETNGFNIVNVLK